MSRVLASIVVPAVCLGPLAFALHARPRPCVETDGIVMSDAAALAVSSMVATSTTTDDDQPFKPIAVSPTEALSYQPLMVYTSNYTRDQQFKPIEPGNGIIHPKAATVEFDTGQGKVRVAIDSTSKDANRPNVIRFDFFEAGTFDTGYSIPLKLENDEYGAQGGEFGPVTLDVRHKGRKIPVHVEGSYYRFGSEYRQLTLQFGTGLEGECQFGRRAYPVRVLDGNSNLKFGDKSGGIRRDKETARRERAPMLEIKIGDTLAIDFGDGTFTGDKVEKYFYGQPIVVNGVAYDVAMTSDGTEVVATTSSARLGTISVPHKDWSATLVGKDHLLELAGGTEPIAVPADTYIVSTFSEYGPADEKGRKAVMSCGRSEAYYGSAKEYVVKPGGKVSIHMGSPLTATVTNTQAPQRRRTMNLNLKLTDASGASVDDIRLADGKRPKVPKIEVLGADGKVVHSAKLEYG